MTTNEVPRKTGPTCSSCGERCETYARDICDVCASWALMSEHYRTITTSTDPARVDAARAAIRAMGWDSRTGERVTEVTTSDVAPAPHIEYDRSMTKNELPEVDMSHALRYSFYVNNYAYALDGGQISLDTPGSYATLEDTRTAALAYLAALRTSHWGVLNERLLVGQTRPAHEGDNCILVDPSGRAFDLWIDVAGL